MVSPHSCVSLLNSIVGSTYSDKRNLTSKTAHSPVAVGNSPLMRLTPIAVKANRLLASAWSTLQLIPIFRITAEAHGTQCLDKQRDHVGDSPRPACIGHSGHFLVSLSEGQFSTSTTQLHKHLIIMWFHVVTG